MSAPQPGIWRRLVLRLLPASSPAQTPVNVDGNSDLLRRLRQDDPTFKCLMDHAAAQFENDLRTALDLTQDDATRLRHANSATGVLRYIEDIEFRRQAWNEDRIRELREKQAARAADQTGKAK